MNTNDRGNELRLHRRRSFLSQKDLGRAVGYRDAVQSGRHERSLSVPPLLIALAYEAVFRRRTSTIFAGFYSAVVISVEANLEAMKQELQREVDGGRASKTTVQKLKWLMSRRPGVPAE